MEIFYPKSRKVDRIMTKQNYLNELKRRLDEYPLGYQKEIVDAFESHFQEGLEAGYTEEEIMNNLGTIEEVMENIIQIEGMPKKERVKEEKTYPIEDDPKPSSFEEHVEKATTSFSSSIEELAYAAGDFGKAIAKAVTSSVKSVDWSSIGKSVEFSTMVGKEEDAVVGTIPDPKTHLVVNGEHSSLDVNITHGETFAYHFQPLRNLFTNNVPTLQVNTDQDTVYFSLSSKMRGQNVAGILSLEIPEDIETISLRNASGDYEIDNIRLESFMGQTNSGDIEIKDCTIHSIQCKSTSGDVQMNNCVSNEIQCVSTSGDLSLTDCTGDLFVQSTSGDIETHSMQAHQIIAKTTSGDIELDSHASIITTSAVSGDIDIRTTNEIERIAAETVAGDIDISSESKDYVAVIKTTAGDVYNRTSLPKEERNKREYVIGDNGTGSILAKTVSGDVSLS